MPYVAVEPGLRIYADDSGGAEQPVVFLHGWPLDSRQWEHQIATLQAQGRRCVAIDARGFGRSDRAWGHYSYDVLADDLRRVIDELELDRATLVGFSLGAGVALRYMSRHDAAGVAQVVLAAAPGGWDTTAIDRLLSLDRLSLVRAATSLLMPDADEVARHWLYGMSLGAMPYATRRSLQLLRDGDLRASIRALTAPTLIMHGAKDGLAPPERAWALHDAIPGSRLAIFQHGGHGAFCTAREPFNAALEAFLARF